MGEDKQMREYSGDLLIKAPSLGENACFNFFFSDRAKYSLKTTQVQRD